MPKSLAYKRTPRNRERAARIEQTLDVYLRDRDGGLPVADCTDEDLVDLLTDLRHYAAQGGFDWEAVDRMARLNFEAEAAGREDD
jgi:hypothetical protein